MTSTPAGRLILIVGPQGAGKTFLARRLCASDSSFVLAPGVMTRAQRDEQDAADLHITAEEYERLRRDGRLCLEAVVGGHHYAYFKQEIDQSIAAGKTVVLLLLHAADVASATTIWPGALRIYLRPNNWKVIGDRLRHGRKMSPLDVTSLIASGKEVVESLDQLSWEHTIPIDVGTDQFAETTRLLQQRRL